MYVYQQSEFSPYCLFTVGYYEPNGEWMPESDHEDKIQAANRTILLNGGVPEDPNDLNTIKTKNVSTVTVTDPDSKLPVDIQILKMESGAMVGIDASFIEQDTGDIYSPYDKYAYLEINE